MLIRTHLFFLSCLAVTVSATPLITESSAAALDTLRLSATAVPKTQAPVAGLELRAPTFTPVSITPFSLSTKSTTTKGTTTKKAYYTPPSPTCTQTIKPDKNGYVPPGTCGSLYNYYPSFAAAIVFAVMFGALMVAHIAQAAIYKKKFCWVIIMGTIWEFGSYVSRALGTRHQQSTGIATISQLLVLLAPLWVNAFDYMVLGRMIQFFVPTRRIWKIKPSLLAFTFVCLDIVSFIIQLLGGAQAGPGASPKAQLKGVHIYMGGIGLQECFIVVFFGLAIRFHVVMLKAEKSGLLAGDKAKWRQLLYVLYASLIAITVRIVYRLIEFSAGTTAKNPIPYHEWYFYVFDGIPMFIAILLWNIRHPGSLLQGPDSEIPPGWLSQKLKGCCGSRKSRGAHQRLRETDDEELTALRARDPSPYGQKIERGTSPAGRYAESTIPGSRDPSPYRQPVEPGNTASRYGDSYNPQGRQPAYHNNLSAPPGYGNGA